MKDQDKTTKIIRAPNRVLYSLAVLLWSLLVLHTIVHQMNTGISMKRSGVILGLPKSCATFCEEFYQKYPKIKPITICNGMKHIAVRNYNHMII